MVTNPELSIQQPLEEVPRLQIEVEGFLAEASVHGGVIMGRGANFVLRDVPGVLCVRLVGPREARVQQAMRLRGLDRRSAEHQLDVNDEARIGYVRQPYSRHPDDPTHYQLIIDSTAMDLDDVVGPSPVPPQRCRAGPRKPSSASDAATTVTTPMIRGSGASTPRAPPGDLHTDLYQPPWASRPRGCLPDLVSVTRDHAVSGRE